MSAITKKVNKEEIKKNHIIIEGRVCCKGHCCIFNDWTEKTFIQYLKD